MKNNPISLFIILSIILCALVISACQSAVVPSSTPSIVISITATASPTPSPTETATPSPTAIPDWEVVDTFGKGEIPQHLYTEDGSKIVVFSEYILTVLDANSMEELSSLVLADDLFYEYGAYLECISSDASLAVVKTIGNMYGSYYIIDLITGEYFTGTIGMRSTFYGFVFSPDNQSLYIRDSYWGTKTTTHSIIQMLKIDGSSNEWELSYYSLNEDEIEAYVAFTDPALSPDGSMMAAGYSDISNYAIYIWDTDSKEQLVKIENQPAETTDVEFSRDGKWLASVGDDAILYIWDVKDGHLVKKVTGLTDELTGVRFTTDGNNVLVYYNGNRQRYKVNLSSWKMTDDTDNLRARDSYTTYMLGNDYFLPGGGSHILFSPDGKTLAVAEGNIQIWDVDSQEIKQILSTGYNLSISSMTFSNDGLKLGVRTSYDDVFVWEIASGELVLSVFQQILNKSQPAYTLDDKYGKGFYVQENVAFSSNGESLFIPNGPALECWNISKQEREAVYEQLTTLSFVRRVSLSEDGKTVYGLLDDYSRLAVWDVQSGRVLSDYQINSGEIMDMLNSTIIAYTDSELLRFIANDRNTEEVFKLDQYIYYITDLNIGTDGKYFGYFIKLRVQGVGYELDIRKADDFSLVASQQFDVWFDDFSINNDGNLLAATENGVVTIFNLNKFTRNVNEPDYTPLPEPATATPYPSATPKAITDTPYPTYDIPTKTPFQTLAVETQQVPTESKHAINVKRAAKLQELGRAGFGKVQSVTWTTDDDLQVVSSQGMFVLDGQTLDILEQYRISDLNVMTSIRNGGSPLIAGDIPYEDVEVWNGNTNEKLLQFEAGHQPAISPNGRWLAFLIDDKGIYTWNLQTNQAGALLKVDDYTISQPVFSPDSRYVAVTLYDRSIRIWDIEKGIVVNAVGGPVVPITDFAFSEDGKFIVAASGGSAWWWNLATNEANHLDLFKPVYWYNFAFEELTFPDAVTNVSMDSTNSMLAIGNNQSEILLYDLKKDEFIDMVLKPNASPMKTGFSANNSKLYSVDADGQLVLWNLTDGARLVQNHAFSNSIHGLVAHENGQISVWSDSTLWKLDNESVSLQDEVNFNVKKIFNIDATGKYIAAYSPYEVSIYQAEDGSFHSTLPLTGEHIELPTYYGDHLVLFGASFDPNGEKLVVYGDGGIWSYDIEDFSLSEFLQSQTVKHATFNNDGEYILSLIGEYSLIHPQLLSVNPLQVRIDYVPGGYFTDFEPGDSFIRNSFSPDKSRIITFDIYNEIQKLNLVDTASAEILIEKLVVYRVMSVAYNPSGTLIAAGLENGSVLLLDADTLETVTTIQVHTASVNHLVFTVDGEKLITAAEDGVVKVWGVE